MKIVVADPLSAEGLEYLKKQPGTVTVDLAGQSTLSLEDEIADAGGLIVRSKTKVDGKLLSGAPRLSVIGRAGAGVDNIDLDEATHRGIVVMNTPGGNSVSAAEHSMALLLSLARRVPHADAALRGGKWDKTAFVGRELRGKTLGVLGLGKIGSVVARRARAFDMAVLAYDPFVSERYAADLDVELAPLEKVFENSDFLSLHLPLNNKTRGLINRETIATMKPGACIINAARGPLIVEKDLIAALESGRIGGAALDVFEKEPAIDPQLLQSGRVIVTPHIAGSTVEAQAHVGLEIARQVWQFLSDGIILNAVNFPSVTPREMDRIAPYLNLGEKLGSFAAQICSLRIEEIGIRYYGDLTGLDYKPISNYILQAVLKPALSTSINAINARSHARERGIAVIETVSSRQRSHSNLISVQLRSSEGMEWVEGAILHRGHHWLVSLDGVPMETPLGNTMLLIRNDDRPGVIGRVGTILGESEINIASFVLGREEGRPYALGVVNTDSDIPDDVLEKIRDVPAIRLAHVIRL